VLGGGAFPSQLCEVVCDYIRRVSILENFGCSYGLNRATRLHCDGCRTVVDTLSKHFGVVLFTLVSQQCAKVLHTFIVHCLRGLAGNAAQLTGGGELDAIRGEAVSNQDRTHMVGGLVVIEDCKDNSAHHSLLTVNPRESSYVLV